MINGGDPYSGKSERLLFWLFIAAVLVLDLGKNVAFGTPHVGFFMRSVNSVNSFHVVHYDIITPSVNLNKLIVAVS